MSPHPTTQTSQPSMIAIQHARTSDMDRVGLLPRLSEWSTDDYPFHNPQRTFPQPVLAPFEPPNLNGDVDSTARSVFQDLGSGLSRVDSARLPFGIDFPYPSQRPLDVQADAATAGTFGHSVDSRPQIHQSMPQPLYYPTYQRQAFTDSPQLQPGRTPKPHPSSSQEFSPTRPRRTSDSDALAVKRRRPTPVDSEGQPSPALKEEDRLLLTLKDDECLPWKDIAVRFMAAFDKTFHVPALQMRYKRLKERLRVWTPTDIEALELAHEYWENKKWEIVSEKMLDHGSAEKWAPRLCMLRWQETHPDESAAAEPRHSSDFFGMVSGLSSHRGSIEAPAPLQPSPPMPYDSAPSYTPSSYPQTYTPITWT